jgi:DMSO/TMAO reductase YedYZ molybdopterin-dependent catalytic subunit
MPRFGLNAFATRFPSETRKIELAIGGDAVKPIRLGAELEQLRTIRLVADFHCVTTWSSVGVHWQGFRFSDLYQSFVESVNTDLEPTFVVFRCQDGYRVSLPLADLLAQDVILASTMNGKPLPIAHGAPLRLVAPAHYGYKNPKHIKKIEFYENDSAYRPASFAFMEHPRGRVEFEERGRGIPGPVLRWLYRPLIGPTIKRFQKALIDHQEARK